MIFLCGTPTCWLGDRGRYRARKFQEFVLEPREIAVASFHMFAEYLLAPVHDSKWLITRAENGESEESQLIQRLLKSGANAGDLAAFARIFQREYLCDLGCVLDGAGIHPAPELPCEFRVFSVSEDEQPEHMVDEIHESLAFENIETELKLSARAATGSHEYIKLISEIRQQLSRSGDREAQSSEVATYSNEQLETISDKELPDRGIYCDDCSVYVPVFESIGSLDELTSIGYKETINRIVEKTGCPKKWAEIWYYHSRGECKTKPCVECGEFLRSKLASQCMACGASQPAA